MPRVQIQMARREAEQQTADPLVVDVEAWDDVDPETGKVTKASFTCRPQLNQWTVLEMMGSDADDDAAVMSAFMTFLREIFEPADWERFRKAARAHRATVQDVQQIVQGIVEYHAATPTLPSSDSSDGPSPTGSLSRVASLPTAQHRAS